MAILAKLPNVNKRRRRFRRLRSLPVAPTLMTLANLLCGFAAIHFAMRAMYDLGAGLPEAPAQPLHQSLLERTLPPFLSVGAALIILGMLFDFLDGLLARVTRSTTNFGGQLDSLADVVTFGVAPATLMVAFMTKELAAESILPSPISEHLVGRAAWVSAALFVAFAAVRLARFNVEHAQADFDYQTFHGIPSPGAGCVLAALILFQAQMGTLARSIIVYSLPFVAVTLAFLMVSRVPYRRFHRAYFLGKKPFSQVMTAVLLLAAFWLIKVHTLLLIVLWYAASGPLFLLVQFVRGRHRPATAVRASATPPVADSERKRA